VGAALGGLVLVRRNVALSTLESHNDVAGFIIAVVGVLYAVLLAFVVIVVWQQFEDAKATAEKEAILVLSLYRDAPVFPPHTEGIRQAIRGYAVSVVDHEWAEMGTQGREYEPTDAAFGAVVRAYRQVQPQDAQQTAFYTESVKRLDDVAEARRTRIFASSSRLPSPLWTVLLFGAAVTVGFTYFFGLPNARAQALMVGSLAAMVSLIIFLVLSLDLPFSGDVAVRPDAMRDAIHEFHDLARL
jgi:hypothetical protein